ncbi:MAG: type II toxin-antitoxin system VapC family toxin [Chloroflexaceae bacterium]|nr:type II toxin-antitoxin system VapC family toxin [Chloroflexaceae bacterium]
MVVCIDTQIVIWGVREEATPTQKDMIPKAKELFEYFGRQKIQVAFPSIVVGESLVRVPVPEHPNVLNKFSQFIILPYDTLSAMWFARIWQQLKDQEEITRLQTTGLSRVELKADLMIIATAVAHGAKVLYSGDHKLLKLATNFIEIQVFSHA